MKLHALIHKPILNQGVTLHWKSHEYLEGISGGIISNYKYLYFLY